MDGAHVACYTSDIFFHTTERVTDGSGLLFHKADDQSRVRLE